MKNNHFSTALRGCVIAFIVWLNPMLFVQAQVSNRSGADSTIFISHTVFVPKHSYTSGLQNWSVATADMNRDGSPDVITGSKLDGMINIHLNDGSGVFAEKLSYPAQKHNRAICTLDANQDGWTDVASVTMMGKLCILLNDGKGGLGPPRVMQVGTMAHDITPADLNGDGFTDLVAAVVSLNALKVFYGDGKGSFSEPPLSIPTGQAPRSVKCGDIDLDGDLDLIAGCDDGRVYIHVNDGNKRFHKETALRSGAANWGLGLADFNDDGLLDIASASYQDKQLCIHLNLGNYEFAREQCVLGGDHNFDLVIDDFDGDKDLDIVTCSTLDMSLGFHLNDGTGKIGPRSSMGSGDWNAGVAAADFDGDGDQDVVSASINDNKINVHRNISTDAAATARVRFCVTGKVYNGDTQEALPKVQISLQDEEGKQLDTQLTDADAGYEFCPPLNQTYYLVVRAPGLPVHRESFEMPAANHVHDVYIHKLTRAFVYGKVRDEETRKALPNALVTLKENGITLIDTLRTNELGAFRYELPFKYNYQIIAEYEGYLTRDLYFDIGEEHVQEGNRLYIDLPPIKQPESWCIRGVVLDQKTQEPIASATIEVRQANGIIIKRVRSREDGAYRACLPFGSYEFNTSAPGYFFKVDSVAISAEDFNAEEDYPHDIELLPLEKGMRIVLENIYYDVDKATLREKSLVELDRLIGIMNENPTLLVEISGHTDGDGTDLYNESLSQNRSQSVVDYLITKGIPLTRMVAKGYGESDPVAPNDTDENKQLNRRTEFKVLGWEEGEVVVPPSANETGSNK